MLLAKQPAILICICFKICSDPLNSFDRFEAGRLFASLESVGHLQEDEGDL